MLGHAQKQGELLIEKAEFEAEQIKQLTKERLLKLRRDWLRLKTRPSPSVAN